MAKLQSGTIIYGNLTVNTYNSIGGNLLVSGNILAGSVGAIGGSYHTLVGNITQTSSGGAVYFNTTGNISAVNIIGSSATINGIANVNLLNSTGNILGAAGILNSLTVNGTLATTSTATIGGAINASGNILSAGAIHNSLTVNGFSNVYIASASSDSALQIVGNVSRGGAGYHDFLRVTSTFGTVANANMFFRLNPSGNLQIINSSYGSQLFELQQSGNINLSGTILINGTAGTSGYVLSSTGTGLQWVAQTGGGGGGSSYGNSNVAQYLPTYTGAITAANLNTTGNIISTGAIHNNVVVNTGNINAFGGYFVGNGYFLTGVITAASNSNYSNANTAAYLVSYTGNISAGNITTTYLQTVGSLTTLGNITAGNIFTNANAVIGGNITAQYFYGNGSQLTGIVTGAAYGNVQVATYLPTYTGVVAASNVYVSGNVTTQYFLGNGSQLSGIAPYPGFQANSALPPSNPKVGETWWDSTTGIMFEYITDGTNQVWVDVSSPTISSNNAVGVSGTIATTSAVITGNLYMNSGYGNANVAYGCRAWVSFGYVSSALVIYGFGSVSSVVRNATGDYTINLGFAMPDTSYAMIGTSGQPLGGSAPGGLIIKNEDFPQLTTSNIRIYTLNPNNSVTTDYPYNYIAFFR